MKVLKERIQIAIEPEIKEKAQKQAESNDTTLSIVIRDFLKDYVKNVKLQKVSKNGEI